MEKLHTIGQDFSRGQNDKTGEEVQTSRDYQRLPGCNPDGRQGCVRQ